MALDRELPFLVPLDFLPALRGGLHGRVVDHGFAIVDEVVSMLVMPYAFGADGSDPVAGLEHVLEEFAELRGELLDLFEECLATEALTALRRASVDHVRTSLASAPAPMDRMTSEALDEALERYELLVEQAAAGARPPPERRDPLRRASSRLELCFTGALFLVGGLGATAIRERRDTLVTGALLAARRAHALALGADVAACPGVAVREVPA